MANCSNRTSTDSVYSINHRIKQKVLNACIITQMIIEFQFLHSCNQSISKSSIPDEAEPKRGRGRRPVNGGSRDLGLILEIRSFAGEGGGNDVKRTNEAEGGVLEGKAERREDMFQRLVGVLVVVAITATFAILG